MRMRVFGIFLIVITFPFVCFAKEAEEFIWKNKKVLISIDNGIVIASMNGGEIYQKMASDPSAKDAIIVADYNFDSYQDIAVLRNSGIEKYYDVFLFDPILGIYRKNNKLSALPCPLVQGKTIVASCFHASACDVWQEKYQYKKGNLVLLNRSGFRCNPANGDSFEYWETYKNGKMIENKFNPIDSNVPNSLR
jgi:hypothetical protein